MTNNFQIFKHETLGEIRGLVINNEPWFVGKDVAAALGYSNTRKAIIDHVDEEDKSVTKRDALGGLQGMTIINENGLYSLIFSCKLPNAKKIKNWIQRDILPMLREHNKPTKNDDNTSESLVNAPDMDKKMRDSRVRESRIWASPYSYRRRKNAVLRERRSGCVGI